jgi:hypothetical protein
MRTLALLLAIAAAPVSAQTIVSDHPPLSPAEAVAVLRGSHSIADYTDYRSPGTGPTVVVMGDSTTPWNWPSNAFEPTRPLANDAGLYAPNYSGYYEPNYLPHYGLSYRSRTPLATRRHVDTRQVATPRPAAPVHIVSLPARPGASAAPRR